MDTRLLRSFVATVRHGSVTVAAAELSYVQSTVTAHIQALERLTGARLLDRLPSGVRPTSVGVQLAERARQLLELEERMLAETSQATQYPAGPVRLCAPESMCAYYLPPMLRRLTRDFPEVRLSLLPAATRAALAALADGTADLALVLEPSVSAAGVDVVDIGEQPLTLIGPPATALPRERPLTVDELAGAGVLLLEDGCSYSDELAAALAARDPAVNAQRYGSVEAVKRCVEAGLGLALLPTSTVRDDLACGRLTALHGPPASSQHLWLATSTHRWVSPAASAVADLLR